MKENANLTCMPHMNDKDLSLKDFHEFPFSHTQYPYLKFIIVGEESLQFAKNKTDYSVSLGGKN